MTALLENVDGATELTDLFVAAFGKDAAVGCFTAAGPMTLARHAAVLLQTPRGLEVGRIMGPATLRQARLLGGQVRGDLIRVLTSDDDEALAEMARLGHRVLDEAERLAAESDMPLSLLDAEAFFDLGHAVVHILHPNPDDLATFAESLSRRVGITVQLVNLALPAEPAHGCGKSDCGEGGCSSGGCSTGGCSTGGCSTGCGSGAVDIAPYFAELREKMESRRIPLA